MLNNIIKLSIIFIMGNFFSQAYATNKSLIIEENIQTNSLPLALHYEKTIPSDVQRIIWTYLDDTSVISFSQTSKTQKSFYRDDFFCGKDGITMPLSFFSDDSTKFKHTYWFRKNLCNLFISNHYQFNAANNDKYIHFADFCKSINLRNLECMIRTILKDKNLNTFFYEKKTMKKKAKKYLSACSNTVFGNAKTNNCVTFNASQDIDREIDLIFSLNDINRSFKTGDPEYNTILILQGQEKIDRLEKEFTAPNFKEIASYYKSKIYFRKIKNFTDYSDFI